MGRFGSRPTDAHVLFLLPSSDFSAPKAFSGHSLRYGFVCPVGHSAATAWRSRRRLSVCPALAARGRRVDPLLQRHRPSPRAPPANAGARRAPQRREGRPFAGSLVACIVTILELHEKTRFPADMGSPGAAFAEKACTGVFRRAGAHDGRHQSRRHANIRCSEMRMEQRR